jgi:sugar O-acyltransferase (sialic acid O-acetyltransferase NeuD family)
MTDAPLLLVAAGGLARETALAAVGSGRTVAGCLDDDPARWGAVLIEGIPVLGGLEEAVRRPDLDVIVCAGKGATRRAIVDRLADLGIGADRFATVVDPAARLAAGTAIGSGCVVLAGVVATADVCLGEHVVCMPNVVLTHDDVIDPFATLCAGVVLGGGVRVGQAAYLGMACSVREGVHVGAGAMLGMGSVVLGDVGDGETWVGVPARQHGIGSRHDGG